MNIQQIYQKFDKIGAFTFATIEGDRPRTRIAHLFAYDDEGLYFRTMVTKPFYAQLKKNSKVALGGMYPNSSVTHDENGMPEWEPGYTVNITGDVKEISLEVLKQKAELDPQFELGIKDIERYPATTTFCIFRGIGEVYDFDFEKKQRSNKLDRISISFGGMDFPFRGVRIGEECVACGACMEGCSFDAISLVEADGYKIDHSKCDVCGDCYTVCPVNAIEVTNEE